MAESECCRMNHVARHKRCTLSLLSYLPADDPGIGVSNVAFERFGLRVWGSRLFKVQGFGLPDSWLSA